MRVCTFPGCNRKHCATGLCNSHYAQARRGQKLEALQTHADWIRDAIERQVTSDCLTVPWQPDRQYPGASVGGVCMSVGGVALILSGSPRPAGMECCHDPIVCNNGRCVNLRHLRWGTHAENMSDQLIARTTTRGERNPMAKLTEDQVREIMAMRETRSAAAIARQYNVTGSTVENIHSGRTWDHLWAGRER